MKKLLGLVPLFFAATIGCSNKAPLDGRTPDRAAAAVDLGRVPAGTLVDFVIGLSPRSPTALHKYVASRRSFDPALAPDEFADLYAARRQDYARVISWMEQHGIIITRANAGRTSVSGLGSAGAVEALFGVELHQYSDAGGTFFAASGPITVANDLVGVVNGVVGLSGSGGWQSHLAWPDLSAGAVITPDAMHTLYNTMTYANPGMGETVAILGAGLAPDPSADVGTFMSHYKPYGVASAASYTQTLLGGPNRDDVTSAQNEQVENILDAEMVLSMAPLANVVHVLTATNSPGLFADGISYIVNQLPKAHSVSVSYGGCERGSSQEMPVIDTLMEQAQAEGQQWFFASGDTGTDGCRDGSGNKHITAGWPTSSPFIVGVGGTMVGNGGVEIVWNQNTTGVGAGGGAPSEVFLKPAYQMGKTPNDNARDTPDVAALAGGGGANIGYQGRIVGPVYGTSVAAPIFAGAWALVDQGKGGGGITDALTKLYAVGGTNAFNDVTTGDNGGPDDASPGYLAGPGYDLATGLGTPNVPNLITNLP